MYRIDEENHKAKYTLLIPAMLDMHFPLLKYAFFSPDYYPVVLDNEKGVTDTGLKYVNNDMCYPSILNIGQMVDALFSGKYNPEKTVVLMPTAGDACRGANYTGALRRALNKAGFSKTKVLSLNVRGLEKDSSLKIRPYMVWRAFVSIFYCDILMILLYQTRPYEKEKGASLKMWQKWVTTLADDIKCGKNLSIKHMKNSFEKISDDFSGIERTDNNKTVVGMVGELYIKYCHMGNWNMVDYIESQNGQVYVNGVTWYATYYIDTHLKEYKGPVGWAYSLLERLFLSVQDSMIDAVRKNGFFVFDNLKKVKEEAKEYVSFDTMVGDGWLIGAEAVACLKNGVSRVLAVQPFGCMPNHVCGRGLYPSLQRKLPGGRIMTVDVDSSGSPLNVYNRVEILLKK